MFLYWICPQFGSNLILLVHEELTYFPRFGAFENLHGHPEPPASLQISKYFIQSGILQIINKKSNLILISNFEEKGEANLKQKLAEFGYHYSLVFKIHNLFRIINLQLWVWILLEPAARISFLCWISCCFNFQPRFRFKQFNILIHWILWN